MRIVLVGLTAFALQACSALPRGDRTGARPECAVAMPGWTADSIAWTHTNEEVRGSVSDYLTGAALEGVALYWERGTLLAHSSTAGGFRLPVGDTASVQILHLRRIGYLPHRITVRLVSEGDRPDPDAVNELSVRLVPAVPPPCSVRF